MTSILKKRKQTRLTSDDSDEPYLCGICLQIMHEPCFLNCQCRRSRCEKCLLKWLKESDKCPSCNTPLNEKEPQPSCRQWSEFCDRVYRTCPNADGNACKKFKGGDYKDLCNHLLVCPRQKIKCNNEVRTVSPKTFYILPSAFSAEEAKPLSDHIFKNIVLFRSAAS